MHGMESFIRLADYGKNGVPRHLASLALILFLWVVIGSLPLIAVVMYNGGAPFPYDGSPAVAGPLSAYDPFWTFYVPLALSFVALLAGVLISVKFIHGRPLLSAITMRERLDMGRVAKGFAVFLLFNIIASAVSYLLEPSRFVFTLDPARLLLLAPIYALFTIIQTSSEELLFRGYLLQAFGRAAKNPLAAACFSSALFMLVHMNNPEMSNGFFITSAYYFAVGYWLCLLTLRDGGLELALGAHASNNLFILVMNYDSSALEIVPSVFKMTGAGFTDMALSLALFIIMAGAAYAFLFRGSTAQAQGPGAQQMPKLKAGRNRIRERM